MKEDNFIRVVNKEIPAYIIYEDKYTLAFLDKKPVCEGHTLVIPKHKYQSIFDIPDEDLAKVMVSLKNVVELLKIKLGATGINILHASGGSAQQSVNHFHIHVIPRKEHDGLDLWPKIKYKKINLKEVYLKLL